MGRTIACTNQKGGVGKTTTVVNLATYLALLGDRVLVIDLDPQGNATSGFGIDRTTVEGSIYDAIIDERPLSGLHVATPVNGLRVVPSSMSLAGAEVELTPVAGRERRLGLAIRAEQDAWDWIFVDCPPSLGLLTVNALTAVQAVLVPVQCEYYALEGLTHLVATINLVRDHLNPDLEISGVVLTMFDGGRTSPMEVAAEVRRHLAAHGVRDDRPAEHPLVRGSEPRPPDRPVPSGLQGCRGLRAPRPRAARPPGPLRTGGRDRRRSRPERSRDGPIRSRRVCPGQGSRLAHPAARHAGLVGPRGAALAGQPQSRTSRATTGTTPNSPTSRRASASTACSSRCSSPRRSTATS